MVHSKNPTIESSKGVGATTTIMQVTNTCHMEGTVDQDSNCIVIDMPEVEVIPQEWRICYRYNKV